MPHGWFLGVRGSWNAGQVGLDFNRGLYLVVAAAECLPTTASS